MAPPKFWKNHLEIPNNQIDDDKNGVIDDIHGYDFVNEDGHPEDENGHGTHVTGLISSIDKKNDDLFGIAPNAVNYRHKSFLIKKDSAIVLTLLVPLSICQKRVRRSLIVAGAEVQNHLVLQMHFKY